MATRNPEEMLRMIMKMMRDEGCVVISPHQEPFMKFERDFLEGIRRIPSSITAPDGMNPYSMAMGRRGRWVFVWVPE